MGDPIIFEGDEERLLKYALLASGFPQTDDLIDKAIGEGAEMKGVTSQELEDFKKIQYIPADSRRKRSTVFLKDPHGKRMVIIKGAPQVVLRRSKVSKELEALFNSHIRDLARRGYRAIAVGAGYTEVEDGLSLIGILPLRDPAREDAKDLIEKAAEMGVEVRLVTGDNRDVAAEIAAEIGIRGSSIYAEVLPEDKYDIVHKLQREGHFVAMTGDGVNDAPALKRADAGIAVSTANDITKSVADIVLTASGLGVIIDGIREGRTVFARMVHYATYRIAETIRLIAFITLTILIYGFFPMTPLQIVVLAILNDIPILMIAKDRAIAAKGPESWEMKRFLTLSTVMGFVGVLNSFILLLILMNRIDFPELQAAMFLKLSLTGHLLLLAVRNRGPWYSFAPSKSLLLAILLTMTVSTSMATFGIFIPRLDPLLVLGVWIYALIWWQITDLTKLKTYRVMER
jgi:H+-transporting ATPase